MFKIKQSNPLVKILYILLLIPLVIIPFPIPFFRRPKKSGVTFSEQK